MFGCKGFAFPTGIAPNGNPSDSGGWSDNGQRSDGLFAALHFSTSWLFLRPRNQTARRLLLDYTSETMAFWLDYLVKHEADGGYEYRVLNDCFMEKCGVPDGRGNYVANQPNINNQLTLSYLRFHLDALLDMAAAAPAGEAPPPQLVQWRDILNHLPPLPTTTANMSYSPNCTSARASAPLPADRCVPCRWLYSGTDDGCEHSLETIYAGVLGAGPSAPGSNPVETSAIFPGSNAVGLASPQAELDVARNTVVYLDSWFQGNAFAQIFASAGRVFGGNEKIKSVRAGEDYLMRTFERQITRSMATGNMWVKEYGGGVETLGSLAYVTESLLQSHEGFIRLFAGLPPGEGASFTGLRARGALVLNATLGDDGSVQDFRIRSEAGQNVTVYSPPGLSAVDAHTGSAVTVRQLPASGSAAGKLWQFATDVDGEYVLTVPK